MERLRGWAKKLEEAENKAKQVPKNWRKMVLSIEKTKKEGKMFRTHILETPPEKVVDNHFACIGNEDITINHRYDYFE